MMPSARNTVAAALACVSLVACSKSNNQTGDSAAAALASATAMPDSSASASSTAATPAATPAAGTAATPSSFSDANILAKADAGDSAEVAIAKYVRANSTNAAVKSYAALLETDHGKGISKVESVAKKTSIAMQAPAGDTTAQETSHFLDQLKSLKGNDLDTAFVNHEIQDHQQDIADAKQMQTAAQNADVKALVSGELPELQKHLDRAQALQKKLGTSKT
jgi:putative membrane protein